MKDCSMTFEESDGRGDAIDPARYELKQFPTALQRLTAEEGDWWWASNSFSPSFLMVKKVPECLFFDRENGRKVNNLSRFYGKIEDFSLEFWVNCENRQRCTDARVLCKDGDQTKRHKRKVS